MLYHTLMVRKPSLISYKAGSERSMAQCAQRWKKLIFEVFLFNSYLSFCESRIHSWFNKKKSRSKSHFFVILWLNEVGFCYGNLHPVFLKAQYKGFLWKKLNFQWSCNILPQGIMKIITQLLFINDNIILKL